MRIGVIGGGVAGLAAADELLRRGHEVLLFEYAPQVGGQLRTMDIHGARLEQFYHHIFTNDTLMIETIRELGLEDRLQWVASKVGFFANGKIWDFVTPQDLLRFQPLPLIDRLRLGIASLYLQRQPDWRKFESVTAEAWLKKWVGKHSYDVIWGPLLYGKFGDAAPEVSMTWFHWKMRLRFGSRRGLRQEFLGYLVGSFAQVWEAYGQRIRQRGGKLFTSAQVERIVVQQGKAIGLRARIAEEAGKQAVQEGYAEGQDGALFFLLDRVIATIPSPVVMRLAPELPENYTKILIGNRYQAVMCLIMVLKHPISSIYWLNITDRSIPFVALIEQTNLISPDHYGGRHVAYISNYIDRTAPLYQQSDDEVLETYIPHLQKINPDFQRDWIEEWHLFREDAAQPIITTNYSQKIPSIATPVGNLFMANNSQVYPEDRGQNYSLRIGREAARLAAQEADQQAAQS